jgi:hypothetical protein
MRMVIVTVAQLSYPCRNLPILMYGKFDAGGRFRADCAAGG